MIPFFQPYLDNEIKESICNTIDSTYIGPGPVVKELEKQISVLTGLPYTALTTSGTMALAMSAVLPYFPIHNIIVPAYGVNSVYDAFHVWGINLIPVDIDETGCMDPESLLNVLKEYNDVDAVCYVHFSGIITENYDHISDLCEEHSLFLIEDAACALGKDQVGEYGDVVTFSFSPHKIITMGQGGAISTSDKDSYNKIYQYISNGRKPGDNFPHGGFWNLRVSDINASMALPQIEVIESLWGYLEQIQHIISDPPNIRDKFFNSDDSIPLHNIVLVENKSELIEELNKRGIQARSQYCPINEYPAYSHIVGKYPNSKWFHDRAVFLPFGLGLDVDEAIYIREQLMELI